MLANFPLGFSARENCHEASSALPSGLPSPEYSLSRLLAILFLIYTRVYPPPIYFRMIGGKRIISFSVTRFN